MASRTSVRIGYLLSALVIAILLLDAAVGLFAPQLIAQPNAEVGWSADKHVVLATMMLLCAAVYAVPRAAVLGAVMITGFCGGIFATHLRVEAGFTIPEAISLVIAALAWGGLWLRDARLRALLPLSS